MIPNLLNHRSRHLSEYHSIHPDNIIILIVWSLATWSEMYDLGQDHGGIPWAAELSEYIFDC